MERHRGTWLEEVQDSVDSWKGRNGEICMGVRVCTCIFEKQNWGERKLRSSGIM